MPLFDAISAAGAFYRIRVLMGPTGRAEIGLVTDVREACCVGSFVCWGRVCPECDPRRLRGDSRDPPRLKTLYDIIYVARRPRKRLAY